MEDKDVFNGINWVLQNGLVQGRTFGGFYDITKQVGNLYFIRKIMGPDNVPQVVRTEITWNGTSPNKYKLKNIPLTEEKIKELESMYKKSSEQNTSKKMKDGGQITEYRVGKHGKELRMLWSLLVDSLNTNVTSKESAEGIIGFNVNGIPVYINKLPSYLTKRVFSSAGEKGPNYTLIEETSPEGNRFILKEGKTEKIFTDPKEFPYGDLPFLEEGTGKDGIQPKEYSSKLIMGANLMNNFSNMRTLASLTSNENLVLNTLNALNTTTNNTEFLQVEQNAGLLNTQNATQRRLLMLAQDEVNNAKRLGLKQMNSNVPSISDYNNSILKLQNLFNNARQIKQDVKNNAVNAFTNLSNTLVNTAGKFIGGGIEAGFKYKNSNSVASNSKGNKLSYKIIF